MGKLRGPSGPGRTKPKRAGSVERGWPDPQPRKGLPYAVVPEAFRIPAAVEAAVQRFAISVSHYCPSTVADSVQ